ncbi:MAG: hypothetical protein M1838_000872 [Thelocarpon superellum]|nr:MAG: hypothetical protein M1838_000872 [Thelocarpon superellum]
MSGRSAYVRKAKADYKEKSGHSHHPPPPQAYQAPPPPAPPPFYTAPSYSNIHHEARASDPYDFEYNPKQARRRSSSIHAGIPGSVSSWNTPSEQSYHRGGPSRGETTSIERSTFRAFMDSKSDSFRTKLSSKFGAKTHADSGEPHMRMEAQHPPRSIGGLTYELPATPMPETLPVRPRTQPRAESSIGQDQLRNLEAATSVRRWTGAGKPPQSWNKLRKDPELWDHHGDTLVYFGHETQQSTRPSPSFRIQSSILEETESAFFITILREGYKYNNDYHFSGGLASPPPSMPSTSPPLRDLQSQASHRDHDPAFPLRRPKVPSAISSLNPGQPTPPSSDTATLQEKETPILHEIYFPAPAEASKMDVLRHHLTTRNVLALLMNKSIVGLNFYQALLDLHERLQVYMQPDTDCASLVIDYLVSNRLDDVRNDPAAAAGLLAWSEGLGVRWHEGWREAFVHCVGMYARLSSLPEFRDVSPVARALLERSHLELQVRIQQAEGRLAQFDFDDIWPVQSIMPPQARSSFDRLRRFLIKFYESVYWTWPPRTVQEGGNGWLTRELVTRLQNDFGALYDYFVDRDVGWEEMEGGNERKFRIVSLSKRSTFRADSDDLPITDYLTGFDNRNNFPHIPHPYPLLPTSIPVQYNSKTSLFGGKKIKGVDEKATERRTALAYSEATNIFLLGSDFVANDLVEAFLRFEKTDQIGEIDPFDARKGRWILLYGILQVLASVSVDTPNLRFKDDVSYFLNPRLRGIPPWRSQSDMPTEEASQAQSHCWKVPKTWNQDHSIGWSELRNHRQIVITSDGIGDGIGRGSASSSDGRTAAPTDRDQRARQWVQGAGGFLDDGDSPPRISSRSSNRASPDGKIKDWPIQGRRDASNGTGTGYGNGNGNGTRENLLLAGRENNLTVAGRDLGRSDYQAPQDW